MLKLVGLPIAVANAEIEVQQIAKYVTRSNDEDGVAYAIQNYIFA
jgi:hydroxymethylpyrimidine pyrophosphatase-like HAD family hydrolase